MNIGQTSIIVYLSLLFASALGFLSTLYFARKLGPEIIGIFSLLMAVITWLSLANVGLGEAMKKRISEGNDQGEFLSATILCIIPIAVIVAILAVAFQPTLQNYVDGFDKYVNISIVWFVMGVFLIRTFFQSVFRTLTSQRMVHIRGLLDPVSIGGKSLFQIILVAGGYGLLGMLVGWMLGGLLVGVIGLYWVRIRPARPSKRHFKSLFEYAKFSWLTGLKSRAFNQVDILLLGAFVSSSLVGVYAVAWSIAKFLELFGNSIGQTMFPEISHTSAQDSTEAAAGLLEDSLAFNGLIAIPGLIGGLVLAERLMRLYGPDFTRGGAVLALLILATLVYSYQNQLLNTLNAIDRPDIAFRINVVFIALNAVLNVVLISQYGIEGAAAATVISAAVGLGLSYYALDSLIDFETPVREPTRQIAAALLMGGVIWVALESIETTGLITHNAIIVVSLVTSGAGVYFLTLLGISPQFRATVNRNLPFEVPFLG
ncbi:oligosaccharide flippase family protein [Natronomonas salsuginis]|uniref:Polysaccharide biosynthesis protein n=1 Tax=Natronomonas salsuginis TaxID=2217661 RepID=A0A4U5J939_9EURY|nr:oligosaccharide flippase family protein [Natronomonas salsuginis]TKR25244.1 polysaccharide biosynthesis protein [Natronomonas salsuginis]